MTSTNSVFLKIILIFFFSVSLAYAHVPSVVTQVDLHDITEIKDPELSQAFYGVLNGYPHTYEIRSSEPFELYLQVLLPDIEGVSHDITGIVIKETGFRGRVNEVARLLGKDASWSSFYEPWGGDHYLKGDTLTRSLEAGVYRIELSSPDNNTPYVLIVGKREEFGAIGYFEHIRRIGEVKTFFGKSKFLVIQSPLVYVPLALLVLIGLGYRMYRRRSSQGDVI